jgi:hypothetical protein
VLEGFAHSGSGFGDGHGQHEPIIDMDVRSCTD